MGECGGGGGNGVGDGVGLGGGGGGSDSAAGSGGGKGAVIDAVRTEKGFPKPDGELAERHTLFSVVAAMVFESPAKPGWA